MSDSNQSLWKTRLLKALFPIANSTLSWQEQGDEAIFSAAWEMVELTEEAKHGRKPLQLDKSVTVLKRMSAHNGEDLSNLIAAKLKTLVTVQKSDANLS